MNFTVRRIFFSHTCINLIRKLVIIKLPPITSLHSLRTLPRCIHTLAFIAAPTSPRSTPSSSSFLLNSPTSRSISIIFWQPESSELPEIYQYRCAIELYTTESSLHNLFELSFVRYRSRHLPHSSILPPTQNFTWPQRCQLITGS